MLAAFKLHQSLSFLAAHLSKLTTKPRFPCWGHWEEVQSRQAEKENITSAPPNHDKPQTTLLLFQAILEILEEPSLLLKSLIL